MCETGYIAIIIQEHKELEMTIEVPYKRKIGENSYALVQKFVFHQSQFLAIICHHWHQEKFSVIQYLNLFQKLKF